MSAIHIYTRASCVYVQTRGSGLSLPPLSLFRFCALTSITCSCYMCTHTCARVGGDVCMCNRRAMYTPRWRRDKREIRAALHTALYGIYRYIGTYTSVWVSVYLCISTRRHQEIVNLRARYGHSHKFGNWFSCTVYSPRPRLVLFRRVPARARALSPTLRMMFFGCSVNARRGERVEAMLLSCCVCGVCGGESKRRQVRRSSLRAMDSRVLLAGRERPWENLYAAYMRGKN